MSKEPLLSLKDLAQIWPGKTYPSIKKAAQRGKFHTAVYLDKQEALKRGLQWREGRGCGRSDKQPFIPISDPFIPSSVKMEAHRAVFTTAVPCGCSSLQADGRSSACSYPQAAGGPAACSSALNPDPGADPFREGCLPPAAPGVLSFLRTEPSGELTDDEIYLQLYQSAPAYNRHKADKYAILLEEMAGLSGRELKHAISEHNRKHPDFRTSYVRVTQARAELKKGGKTALLGRYGKSRESKIRPEWHEAFKNRYLKEGGPSVHSCWIGTLGEAKRLDDSISPGGFPSEATFMRELCKRVPKQTICFYREGHDVWKRKYSIYVNRNWLDVAPGAGYVSDHAQIDVAVRMPDGKVVFPWITVIADERTDKYLGWTVYPGNPNSDRIFEALYRAIRDYGVPTDFTVDNGKDYRCRDLMGGRKKIKFPVDEMATTALVLKLKITSHFALPFNAPTKTAERTFLRLKEWFSKHVRGYRGGNVKERPGVLKKEIKEGSILAWDQFEKRVDEFITTVINRTQSNGKRLKSMCPDELFEKERKPPVMLRPESLRILCMRSSKPCRIGRNGIHDTKHDVWFYDGWMEAYKGEYVYYRQDDKYWHTIAVYTAGGKEQWLGEARIDPEIAAHARTDAEKASLSEKLASKRRAEWFARSAAGPIERRDPETIVGDAARGANLLNERRGYTPGQGQPKVVEVMATVFDNVPEEKERQAKIGTHNFSRLRPPSPKKPKIYVLQAQRRRDKEIEEERAENERAAKTNNEGGQL